MEQLPEIIHDSWRPYLQRLFDDEKMLKIKYEILPKTSFYPAPNDIFKVFKMPLDKIKVVILGQDVYPNGEGIGYAFAVNKTTKIPPSLEVIRQEIINSGVERSNSPNIDSIEWRTLKHWREQGVFLLNAALTVEKRHAGSHTGYWMWFTREIIKIISLHSNKPIWLMWGAKARQFTGSIHTYYRYRNEYIGNEYEYVLESVHPAAEKYQESTSKFSGNYHFKTTNLLLKQQKKSIINW